MYLYFYVHLHWVVDSKIVKNGDFRPIPEQEVGIRWRCLIISIWPIPSSVGYLHEIGGCRIAIVEWNCP